MVSVSEGCSEEVNICKVLAWYLSISKHLYKVLTVVTEQ